MSLEPVPLLFRARGTTRESLIEGAKQKHTQREGLYDLRIRCRGVGQGVVYSAEFCIAYSYVYRSQRSWGKVIFSEACVKNSVHRGGEHGGHGGMHGGGMHGRGHAW